jgi:DNA-binding NarL/FixJ family response regulator
MVRVGLVVQGTVLRKGLEAVMQDLPEVEIVHSAGWLPEGDPVVQIDVLIVSGPETDGEALLEGLPVSAPPPAVLLLSDDPGVLRDWIDLPVRALGALPAAADEESLAAAIAALSRGLAVWHPELLVNLQVRVPDEDPGEASDLIEPLTDRELEVLQRLALGHANKRIALDLAISEHTVKFHISSIYGKLYAGNRTEAVRIGLKIGLISI